MKYLEKNILLSVKLFSLNIIKYDLAIGPSSKIKFIYFLESKNFLPSS